tara:strand:- start:1291 stop:2169 length:879 start_codon:yes stop_codon:yes gene_type:complete
MSNKITLLPDYIDIVQQSSIEFYKTGNNLINIFRNYLGELQTSIDFEGAKSAVDIVESTKLIYEKLNETDFTIKVEETEYAFDDIFKLFFIEKYQTLTSTMQNVISSNIPDNVYFVNFSDDIGNITNDTSVLDNSTSPYSDVYDARFNPPNGLHASIFNKVSQNELNTSISLNLLTDGLLKTSLSGIWEFGNEPINDNLEIAKTSHGRNLITDSLYIDRLNLFKDPILSEIKNTLNAMADFVQFFKDVNYRDRDSNRTAKNLEFIASVEGVQARINLLKKKINPDLEIIPGE